MKILTKMKKHLLFFAIFIHFFSFAQNDSLALLQPKPQKSFLKRSIVPLSLIGTGLIINYSNGVIGKENLQEQILNSFPDFETNADNFLLFVPTITMYTADLLKIKSKNSAFDQTKYLTIALLINNVLTIGIKEITQEERPNGENNLSFPSGHASNAFVMATVLHHEFIDTSPWLAYSGYLFATTTGAFRILNNKHWVSDVLVGAGLGILVTDLVYRFEPLKNWNPFKNEKVRTTVVPSYYKNSIGLYANIQF
jgi:membrane-associated phospholipid phosphatase